jgi:hypothetical protein
VGEGAAAYAHVGGGETDAAFIGRAAARIREIAAGERTGPVGHPNLHGPDQALGATVTALVGPAGRGETALGAIADTDNEKEAS